MSRLPTLRPDWLGYFFLSLAASALMISTQSLWIDEAETWTFARQPTLKDWLATLTSSSKISARGAAVTANDSQQRSDLSDKLPSQSSSHSCLLLSCNPSFYPFKN